MGIYKTFAQFKTADRKIRKNVAKHSEEFRQHVMFALDFFHTEGNHNIQILNDVLDTATAGRFQRNKLIDWIAPIVGHTVVKDGNVYLFGAKNEEADYDAIGDMVVDYLMEYPDWYTFKTDPAPEAFDAEDAIDKLVKLVTKRGKEFAKNGFTGVNMTDVIASIRKLDIQTKTEVAA